MFRFCGSRGALVSSLILAAGFLAVVSLLAASPAAGSGRSWQSYLAPASACPGADSTSTGAAARARSVVCLVNWARGQDRRGGLRSSGLLQQAAAAKGKGVATCGAFTHEPCGASARSAIDASGYRAAMWGENMWLGPLGMATAREAVSLWLQSPAHRANVLRPGFRDVGVALVRAPGLLGDEDGAVWVAAFGTPKA